MMRPVYMEKLVLRAHADRMREFHDEHGHYADKWQDLRPFIRRENPRAPLPDRAEGNAWFQDDAGMGYHTFVIAKADAQWFRIDAIDQRGRVTFTVSESHPEAQRLLPVYCTWEVDTPPEREPVAFLERARRRITYAWPSPPPTTWPEVPKLHWSNLDHWRVLDEGGHDPAARPGPDVTNLWRPPGSLFTYELTIIDDENFVIRSHNRSGLMDYILMGPKGSPLEIRTRD